MPRDQKPRRGNGDDDDDDDDNDATAAVAAVLITFIVSLFFALATSTVLHRCSSTLHMTKKEEQERSVFLNQLYSSNS